MSKHFSEERQWSEHKYNPCNLTADERRNIWHSQPALLPAYPWWYPSHML